MHPVNGTGNSPSPGRPTPGVVKQDKSSGALLTHPHRAVLWDRDFFFVKDRPKGPSTANRQPPAAANHHQPPPTAINRQSPTANRQPPTHGVPVGIFGKPGYRNTSSFFFFVKDRPATTTRSDPQRVRMGSGERPTGPAKGKQPNT